MSRWWPECWLMEKQMTAVQCGRLVRKLGKTVAGRKNTEKRAHSSCQRHLYVGHFLRHTNFVNHVTVYLQLIKALGEMLYSPVQKWVKFCPAAVPTVTLIGSCSGLLLSSVKDSIDTRGNNTKLKVKEEARLESLAWITTMFMYPENFKASTKLLGCWIRDYSKPQGFPSYKQQSEQNV